MSFLLTNAITTERKTSLYAFLSCHTTYKLCLENQFGGKKKKIISGCFRYYYLLLSPSGSATCFTELIKEYFQLQASRTTEKKASTEIKRQK